MLDNARLDLRRDQYLVGLNAATKQLRDTQLGLVAQDAATVTDDQAQIAYATLQLGYTRVTASIAGRTGVRLVDAGNMVHATDTTGLVVLTQIAPVSVLFTLPEDDVGAVNRQLAAGPLGVAASSRAANKVLGWGTVLLVNNQIDQTTGTILLKATFPNLDHALWPGQFVDVQLRIETRHGAVTVPAAAVQRGPQGVFVYVIKADDTAEMRPVTVSTANAGGPMALIESGIAAGERVVIDGQLKLRPGTRVTVTPGSTVTPAGPPPPSGPPPP
jgi:multidrug efflux system membrane fusion protein